MADIVNLRMARKHKARAEKERAAEQNRALHGRSKAEREQGKRTAEASKKFLDGHRLSDADPAGEN
ncbi:DUF4169 family protein [Aquamicrobium soli]|jgi:hypothetical protein|uniref:DUF4169 family protein n=1 Tax=Aquamicrobium soli TaxID=1811518 RepID=A0ABV7KFG7_9HYPH